MLDDLRMIDGYVSCALLEVIHRIAALTHDVRHHTIRFDERSRRLIHESLLQVAPLTQVALARLGRERRDPQTLPLRLAPLQFRLRCSSAAATVYRSVVFGTELAPKPPAPASSQQPSGQQRKQKGCTDYDQDPGPSRHHSPSSEL